MTALYDAVLFDRDGTLIVDVPYNGDPRRVVPMPGARAALDRLRAAGMRLGVVTNQSGLARGRFAERDLTAVNARVDELLGPFDTWQICPHGEDDGCRCRKPAPGLIHRAAAALGTRPDRCFVVGDIGRDMAAAAAAGATGILVPTADTLPAEVAAAPHGAADLTAAVELILQRRALLIPAPRPDRQAPDLQNRQAAGSQGRQAPNLQGRQAAGPQDSQAAGPRGRQAPVPRSRRAADPQGHRAGTVLVARSDSAGDILLTGPAIRAVAAGADRVVLLCGPRGRAAADLLPGVDEIVDWPLPWIDPDPAPVDAAEMAALTARLAAIGADEAVICTSFHQSALPLALLLRTAGVGRITAISEDYPGSLLDVRHRVPAGLPEAERALSVAAAAGFGLPPGDDGRLRIRDTRGTGKAATRCAPAVGGHPGRAVVGRAGGARDAGGAVADRTGGADDTAGAVAGRAGGDPVVGNYVVVHPGASCEARACPPQVVRSIVDALERAGHRVLVTAGPDEHDLATAVGGEPAGPTSMAALAALIAGADCLIVGNTGPAHLAAAVGTPVVSLYAPTVPYGQWGPYRVPQVRLGDATAPCRDTRVTRCPVPGHPCLSTVEPAEVLDALRLLGVTAWSVPAELAKNLPAELPQDVPAQAAQNEPAELARNEVAA